MRCGSDESYAGVNDKSPFHALICHLTQCAASQLRNWRPSRSSFGLQLRQFILHPGRQGRIRRFLQIRFIFFRDFIVWSLSGERLGHDQVRNRKLLVVGKRRHFAGIGESEVGFAVLQLNVGKRGEGLRAFRLVGSRRLNSRKMLRVCSLDQLLRTFY